MGLSLRSREIVLHIGMRQAAGFSFDDVAIALNRKPPELRHLQPPPSGKFTKLWVQARLRVVRREIEGDGPGDLLGAGTRP
jgi:hypothetical protein